MRSKKVTYVKATQDELVIRPVTQMTTIRKMLFGLAIGILLAIVFFNVNAAYGWIDFPAF